MLNPKLKTENDFGSKTNSELHGDSHLVLHRLLYDRFPQLEATLNPIPM